MICLESVKVLCGEIKSCNDSPVRQRIWIRVHHCLRLATCWKCSYGVFSMGSFNGWITQKR